MREDQGYQEARRLLKERYGQSYMIAAAHVKRLVDSPAITADDRSALQQFSIQLTSCVNTLREIGYISKLDNHDNLKIIDRLPYTPRLKWRDTEDRIVETGSATSSINLHAIVINLWCSSLSGAPMLVVICRFVKSLFSRVSYIFVRI